MATSPVRYHADYVERRSRVTTFFRLLLAVPHFVVLFVYAIVAWVALVVAWFALVITGRYPQGLYDFMSGYLRYVTAVYGYASLLTDEYPPFGPAQTDTYPVHMSIGPPKARYSRLKVLLRAFLAIPVMLIAYAMQLVWQTGAFLAWFAIVVLGRQPRGLQDMTNLGFSYYQRAFAYLFLLTEDWPPFTDEDGGVPAVEPPPSGGSLGFAAPEAPQPARSRAEPVER